MIVYVTKGPNAAINVFATRKLAEDSYHKTYNANNIKSVKIIFDGDLVRARVSSGDTIYFAVGSITAHVIHETVQHL